MTNAMIAKRDDPAEILAAIAAGLGNATFQWAAQTFAVGGAATLSGALAIGWHYFVCDTDVYVARNAAVPAPVWEGAAGSEFVPAGERFYFYVADATYTIAAITNGAAGRATVV